MSLSESIAGIPSHSGPDLEAHWNELQRDLSAWVHFYRDKCIVLSGVTRYPYGSSSSWGNFHSVIPASSSDEALGKEVSQCLLECRFAPTPSDDVAFQPTEPKHDRPPAVFLSKAKSQKEFDSNSVFARITCLQNRTISIEAHPAIFRSGGHLSVSAHVSCGHEEIGKTLRKVVVAVVNLHEQGLLTP